MRRCLLHLLTVLACTLALLLGLFLCLRRLAVVACLLVFPLLACVVTDARCISLDDVVARLEAAGFVLARAQRAIAAAVRRLYACLDVEVGAQCDLAVRSVNRAYQVLAVVRNLANRRCCISAHHRRDVAACVYEQLLAAGRL